MISPIAIPLTVFTYESWTATALDLLHTCLHDMVTFGKTRVNVPKSTGGHTWSGSGFGSIETDQPLRSCLRVTMSPREDEVMHSLATNEIDSTNIPLFAKALKFTRPPPSVDPTTTTTADTTPATATCNYCPSGQRCAIHLGSFDTTDPIFQYAYSHSTVIDEYMQGLLRVDYRGVVIALEHPQYAPYWDNVGLKYSKKVPHAQMSRVHIRSGEPIERSLSKLAANEPNTFDFVFLDDFNRENYLDDYEHAIRLLRSGGLLVVNKGFNQGGVLTSPELMSEVDRVVSTMNMRIKHDGRVTNYVHEDVIEGRGFA
ncbi:unnamed protein product [Nippostrongylus brasiliensis]|uniref:Methyltranfer_dom domain-containing protein n=1 Tax=Nippostrongylus brasiliensis TaxID=27835 RepID=A0A158QXU7_NIPBR|nr:unnamed protein product [Nippostrongylus brasiliensis]